MSGDYRGATIQMQLCIRTIEEGMCRSLLFRLRIALFASLALSAGALAAFGDAPPFDLIGPKVDVHVQRSGVTLPIAQVPNLLPGDRLWIHPDLPESQSTHYILIVAFLRGATNPPPADWFTRVETWNQKIREEGVFVVVPAEAEQAMVFLAPETGGDFNTLRKAVRDRPGSFVRAGQDLQQASWDRLRLDDFLRQVKTIPVGDSKVLKEKTELLAGTLGIKVDQGCFERPAEEQASCLMQHPEGLVMDDSNAQSVVSQMANGSAADLMNQLSYSARFGGGAFSPYVGAIVDMARILASLHTAKYQYIPALALPQKPQPDTLNLRLNVPPSFRDPKSVIVVALPPVGPSHPPAMRPLESAQTSSAPSSATSSPASGSNTVPAYCATKPDLAFFAQGAPLVYASGMAHDLTLHLDTKATQPDVSGHAELFPSGSSSSVKPAGAGIDIPVEADPLRGGFVLKSPLPEFPEGEVTAELRGKWGFDPWEGPKFHLRQPHPGGWSVQASDMNALIIDREDTVHIQGENTMCVEEVNATLPDGSKEAKPLKLAWKSPRPDQLEVTVPLKEAKPGTVTIAIHQYGLDKPEQLQLKAYAEAAAIEHLTLSAGDKVAVLKGKRLDEVDSADLAGISFIPAVLNRVQDYDQLAMNATGVTATLRPGTDYSAKVTLRDGRTLHVPATVDAARPQVDVLSKGIQQDQSDGDSASSSPVRLGSPDDLPLQRRLVFFLRSRIPSTFPRNEKIELAAVDGSFGTTLSLADSSLMLEDAHTAVAVLDPYARFGASAFGPIQLRAVTAAGVTGDWTPLGTLVRLPGFTGAPTAKELRCPRNPAKPCQLTGNNLFLITQVAVAPDMSNAVDVPPEFTGNTLNVPNLPRSGVNGNTGTLYLRLRDDPENVQTLNLPITLPTGSAASADSAMSAFTIPAPAAKPDTPAASPSASQPAPTPKTTPDSTPKSDSASPTGPNF